MIPKRFFKKDQDRADNHALIDLWRVAEGACREALKAQKEAA